MDRGGGADPFATLKEAGEEYKVYDSHYEKIGKVDDLIVDEGDRVSFVGVKTGFFGTNSTLVPVEKVRVNDKRRLIEISESAETIKDAPHFGKSEELTPDLQNRVRAYFELEGSTRSSREHETRDPYSAGATSDDERVDVTPGERAAASQEGSVPASGSAASQEGRLVKERQPEFAEPGAHVGERERAPEQTSPEEQPISERLSEEQVGLAGWLTSGSGVTVHRIRR
jgi:hypothetical protein